MEWLADVGMWLASEFAGTLADLIPGWGYYQNAVDVYAGVKEACIKSKDLADQIYAGRGVSVAPGQSSMISMTLYKHSATCVAKGMFGATWGVLSICADAAIYSVTAVGSSLVNWIKSVIEKVIAIVDTLVQRFALKRWIDFAKKEWYKVSSKSSIAHDPKRFNKWFLKVVLSTPVLASILMCSGYISHPYKFLKLMDIQEEDGDYGETVFVKEDYKQKVKSFNKGVHYIQKLKELSGKYVAEYSDGYSLVFSSSCGVLKTYFSDVYEGRVAGLAFELGFVGLRKKHCFCSASFNS